jgi:superfamily II DNA or RNA helicase
MGFIKTPKTPNTFIRETLLGIRTNKVNGILTKNGYRIQKSNIDNLNGLKQSLTVKPYLPDEDEKKIKAFNVYTEDEKTITIPRFFGIHRFGEPVKTFSSNTKTNATFTGKLRENQIKIIDSVSPELIKKGGGLLIAGCGVGKTTMGLYLGINQLKEKTLVLTHKTFLQDQWIKRAKEFTTAKIGIIRQNIIPDSDCDIVIGMIQSISKRDYDHTIFDRFGFVIIDEAHHFASPIFSQALFKCGSKYILGLTATPKRADKLTKVLHWHVGDVLYRQKKKPNKQVLTKIFKYSSKNPLFVEKTRWSPQGLKANNVGMINNLVEISTRNAHIINIINEIRKSPERKILILSGRKSHLTLLKNSIDAHIKQDEEKNIIEKGEIVTSYYMGGMKAYERQYAEENADILFGTYDMAHEGLDIDRLNTIILATPKRNIIQAIGRIMRRILKVGDVRPLIIDIVDQLSVFSDKSQGRARLYQYQEGKYKIENFQIDDSIDLKQYENILQVSNVEDLVEDCIPNFDSSSDSEDDPFEDLKNDKRIDKNKENKENKDNINNKIRSVTIDTKNSKKYTSDLSTRFKKRDVIDFEEYAF